MSILQQTIAIYQLSGAGIRTRDHSEVSLLT